MSTPLEVCFSYVYLKTHWPLTGFIYSCVSSEIFYISFYFYFYLGCVSFSYFNKLSMTLSLSKGHIFFFLIFSFSSVVKEVSHRIKGLRSLSIDQSLSLNIFAFSILKRDSKSIVACKFEGDNLLCSDKNCCFLVIFK